MNNDSATAAPLAISLEERLLVRDIVDAVVLGAEVRIFGSRSTGRARPFSDLDLLFTRPARSDAGAAGRVAWIASKPAGCRFGSTSSMPMARARDGTRVRSESRAVAPADGHCASASIIAHPLRTARPGQTVVIPPGDHFGALGVIDQPGLTLTSPGPGAVLHADGRHAEGKGMLVVRAPGVRIENLKFRGARVPDRQRCRHPLRVRHADAGPLPLLRQRDGPASAGRPDMHLVGATANSATRRATTAGCCTTCCTWAASAPAW